MKSFLLSLAALALSLSAVEASIIIPKPFPPPPHKPAPTHTKPSHPQPSAPAEYSTNLTQWTQNHITTIFQTLDDAVFNSSVHCFFDDNIDIQFNGIPTTLDTFIDDIVLDKTYAVGANLDFINAVEAGSVGLYYNTTVIRNVNGTIINSWVVASINLVISPDTDSKRNCSGDARRVKTLTRVSLPPQEVVAADGL
ncbi:hypothetical protein CVT26_007656 [Gymnopilus dilepis]|uniref:SnoaL-like domain-containing protein n=1 Tax=Gymnopilus dilepis TaxID=231916 RepID=A0A409VZK8_9AGAR|nr:hypothetical protein CVT26_007656 [Gymnopilus dilepis]